MKTVIVTLTESEVVADCDVGDYVVVACDMNSMIDLLWHNKGH